MLAIQSFDNEVEAEIARGALESEGIIALVRFTARSGYPRYAAGSGGFGFGAPLSTYELLVPAERADDARALLASPDARESHPGPWRRWIFRAITLIVLLAFLWSALRQLSFLF